MIAERIERGTAKLLFARYAHAVRCDLDLNGHALEIFGYGCDPVGFFDSQLVRVSDNQAFLRRRTEHGEDRNFIDQRRRKLLFNYSAANR